MMTNRERYLSLIFNEKLTKTDAIVLLEGDGLNRITQAVNLYHQGYSKKIISSGGLINKPLGSVSSKALVSELIKQNVKRKDILIENKSMNTREQALEVIPILEKNNYKSIILVASHYHQPRAFLTFLKVVLDNKLDITIFNSPARELSWFSNNPWGKRVDLLALELEKIDKYSKLGHIATFEEGIRHQQKKESLV
ncbi:MAG: hypothetical protein A2182_03115 [Candidatus Pacebacteria bacterium RIFOXYA1_FULL_38_18]|nr:MAG: hypothetical protein A2182_03115 [Candidatus Pacebacteria bacterium RIFOXYA1_FULL_38_18]OGJ39573.1 MAG: hypothetical protein A2411_01755 [Candidatus Pacebacteria bacterium RIFOXYC1_FULL_39_21]